ncbi:MAG: hypothetical protein JW736_08340 [Deltaproteobacteria bacterium]|nr:hypothetical protein [Deltaproteobacteria bacterium]MBN2688143.1 hypothetical protein [Deltaproteobacteria bacterium]
MKHDAFKKYSGGIDALRKKGGFIPYLVMVIVLFGGGVILGYYIWGVDKQQKPDYTKYLKDTIVHLQKLEESKAILTAETKSLKTDVAVLKKSAAQTEDKLAATKKQLEEKLSLLEKENAALKQSVSEKSALISEANAVKEKYEELQKECALLKEKMPSDARPAESSVKKSPEPQTTAGDEVIGKPSTAPHEALDKSTPEGAPVSDQKDNAVEIQAGEQK